MRVHSVAARRVSRLGLAPLALLALALSTAACGPAVLEYSVVDSPSGKALKLESLDETLRPGGEAALLLRFHTDLDLSDARALESEVADVWEYLRPHVEARGMRFAVIQAVHWEPPSWERRGAAAQYVIERSDDGSWAARPDTSPGGSSS